MVAWLKCEFMQDHIGGTYSGVITGVTSFGLFVELSGIHVEGLVHITSLPQDYYDFDSANHQLLGRNEGLAYSLGQVISVVVASVNLDERKIDFQIDKAESRHPKGRKQKRDKQTSKKHSKKKRRSSSERKNVRKKKKSGRRRKS